MTQPEIGRSEALAQEIEPVVRGIIRRKLRVTLDPADGRRENQNALELFGDVWVKLLRDNSGEAVRNLRSYAAVVTYHACSEYFREKYPARSSLRNRAHYFLTHHPSYAVWEQEGDLVCGYSTWRDRNMPSANSAQLAALDAGSSAKPVERMTPADWDTLFDSFFESLGAPALLDELVNRIAPLVGSVDAVEAEKNDDDDRRDLVAETPSSELSPEQKLRIRLQLQKLWTEIVQLTPRQRCAYLLNPTEGEIDVFPANGIASIARIGRAIDLSDEQFALISKELAIPITGTADEKFATLWNRLPLADKLIARLLEATPQQVINLRKVARERLGREMKNFR